MVLDLEKLEIQWVARFISRLRENIRDEICLLSLWNLSEAIDLFIRIENNLAKEEKDIQEENVKIDLGVALEGHIEPTIQVVGDIGPNTTLLEKRQLRAFFLKLW